MKKKIWIVNEYNAPGVSRTRQILLAQLLRERGYDVYIIASSTNNSFASYKKVITSVQFDGEFFYVVKAPNYSSNAQRAIASLVFQKRLWKYRKNIPNPDVIVCDFAGFFGNVVFKWKKRYGTRVIFDILDLWPEGFVEMGFIKRNSLLAKFLYSREYYSYKNADGF